MVVRSEKYFQPNIEQSEQTKFKLEFQSDELKKVLADENFSPAKLLLLLEKQYPNTYEQDVGVFEGYTLQQHTLMVMKQFEKYFGKKDLPSGIDRNIFRLILALHDIGKPKAISEGGKHLQHEYTQISIRSLFKGLDSNESSTDLALALVSGDPIGKYLTGQMTTTQTKMAIEEMADRAKIPMDKFFELLCIYYKVDAGSYTENAGGLRSLDDLFDFDEQNNNLNFAPHIQNKIEQIITSTN